MARIKFADTFAGWVKLFKDVKKKHDAEPAPKTLTPFLDEELIVMTDDLTAVDNAVTANTDFEKAGKEAEKQTKTRNNLFDPVWNDYLGSVQALKTIYRKNPQKLGDWSVDVTVGGRITHPPDFAGRQQKVILFIEKHDSFAPGTSPLEPYLTENEIDIAANKLKATNALTAHNAMVVQDNIRETKRLDRDTIMAPVIDHVRGAGQFLIKHFANNPKKASDWGFEVDDSPQDDKTRDVVVTEQSSKVLYQLAVGKIVENTGAISAKIYKGKTASGTPIVLSAGQKFTVVRGYGTMTVVNESSTEKVTIEATFNR